MRIWGIIGSVHKGYRNGIMEKNWPKKKGKKEKEKEEEGEEEDNETRPFPQPRSQASLKR